MSLPKVRYQTPSIDVYESRELETSDTIMDSWKTEMENIFDIVNEISDKSILPITLSKDCMSNSLTSKNRIVKNENCIGCKTVKTFIEEDYLDDNKTFSIMSGENTGTTVRMFSFKNTSLEVIKDERYKFLKDGSEHITTTNPFLNYVIVSTVMNKVLEEKGYPTFVPYLWSYICKDTFNILINIKQMKTLREVSMNPLLSKSSPLAKQTVHNNINDKIMREIFTQLSLLCYFYSNVKFNHGEPSIGYINFCSKKANFIYQNKAVKSAVTLLISPSTKSCISWNGKRFHCNRSDIKYVDEPFENRDVEVCGDKYLGSYEQHRREFVKIGNQADKFLEMRNEYGYYGIESFDYVMFLSSLIVDRAFYETFKESEDLMEIWRSVWKKEEYNDVIKEFGKIQKNNFTNVFNVVKKYYFNKNILNDVVSKL